MAQLIEQFLSVEPYNKAHAQPFEWTFTRKDLHQLLDRLEQPTPQPQLAA